MKLEIFTVLCLLATLAVTQETLENQDDYGTQETFVCEDEGRYADPDDCGAFYDCIDDGVGGFYPYHRTCRGSAYDADQERCVDPLQVPDCQLRQGKAFNFMHRSSFDGLCKNASVTFTCGNCESLIQCVDGKAFEDLCVGGQFCQKHTVFGGVCKKVVQDTEKTCTCDKVNAIKADPYDSSFFFHCDVAVGRMEYSCPNGMTFNSNDKVCENSRNIPACQQMGTFVVPDNCSIYYTCIQTPDGWLQSIDDCNEDSYYNKTSGKCEDACTFTVPDFKCLEEGRFTDPDNCHKYFECLSYATGEFTQIKRSCPLGYRWGNAKGLCVAETNKSCGEKKIQSTCKTPARCSLTPPAVAPALVADNTVAAAEVLPVEQPAAEGAPVAEAVLQDVPK